MADCLNAGRYLVGLIGRGIQASGSPGIHETEGRELGLKLHYHLIDLDRPGLGPERLAEVLDAVEMLGFAGVNVTHPCKQAVISLLHDLSPEAEAIGAVNTVVFTNGRRHGHNTDCWGFEQSLRRGLSGARLETVLLVGAGGGGSAVSFAALRLGVGHLAVFDQDRVRSAALVERLRRQFGAGRASVSGDPAESLRTADGLIHATPTGMAQHPGTAVPADLLRPEMWVADIVYFPLETELLRQAKERGCRTLDGGGMAVFQAAKAFQLFTGIEPDSERMLARFRRQ